MSDDESKGIRISGDVADVNPNLLGVSETMTNDKSSFIRISGNVTDD